MSPRNLTNPVSRPGFAARVLEHRSAAFGINLCRVVVNKVHLVLNRRSIKKVFVEWGSIESNYQINTKTSFCLLCEFTHYPAPLIFVRKLFPNWKAGFFDNFSQIFFMIFPWFFMIFPIFPGFFGDFPPDFSMIFPRIFVPDFFFWWFFSLDFLMIFSLDFFQNIF